MPNCQYYFSAYRWHLNLIDRPTTDLNGLSTDYLGTRQCSLLGPQLHVGCSIPKFVQCTFRGRWTTLGSKIWNGSNRPLVGGVPQEKKDNEYCHGDGWFSNDRGSVPRRVPASDARFYTFIDMTQAPVGCEVCRMHRAYQEHSPRGPPSPPSQQNKVILQREYREKEGECFNMLRDVIRGLTGEELRTRQEILRKAIDILSTAPETRKQSEAQVDTLTPYEAPSPGPTRLEDMAASTHVGYLTQSVHYPQNWQPSAEFDVPFPYYGVHVQDQQYHFMSGMDSAFNSASSLGYGGDGDLSRGCPQL